MEATLFSGWIYDVLKPFAGKLEMGNPAMMKAIAAAKKKNDQLDARKIADLVRCNLLPGCYVASAGDARFAAVVALPATQVVGHASADEEPNERLADGGGSANTASNDCTGRSISASCWASWRRCRNR